ncbi:putative alkaline shock family protein YloU [Caldicoprobacter guelmensis]|uniref:alkaline shock response membrane anchor protein AmaP n=1 Tax=Caldicoprobacter guelmensis TaxID=1170224 RepID=UPI001956F880|nr:alkaline shock response membrane anchor protein AmaP [Caldicoprobacter guelmensis]MBM7581291.1 putative alkaline shock family protein YloU [Caldicoprobacter guelmensis]
MKISWGERALLVVYTLAIAVASLIMMAIAVGIVPFKGVVEYINDIQYDWDFALVLFLISLAFLAASLKLLFLRQKRIVLAGTLIKNTELGMIRVSINTLDMLVQKAVRGFSEVKDVKSLVVAEPDGVRVRLNMQLMPDVNIPEISQAVQKKVKEYVEATAGIVVKEVYVYIDNLAALQRSRVE